MRLGPKPQKYGIAHLHVFVFFIIIIILLLYISGNETKDASKAHLTCLHRMPYKHAILFGTVDRRASKHAFRFILVCFGGSTPRMACHRGGWLVYTQSFLRVRGFTVRWPRTKGTARNERVHSFMDFCLIPLSKTCSFDVPAKNL